MQNTFYLLVGDGVYGDVTNEQAERIASHLAEVVSERFDVDVQFTSDAYEENNAADPDGDIQNWINAKWNDVAAEVL